MASVARDEKGKNVSKAIIKFMNPATGKESTKDTAFNEMNWGAVTRNYLLSIQTLRDGSFAKIVAKTLSYSKLNQRGGATHSMSTDADVRAVLVDLSDDGMPILLFFTCALGFF
jgi:hypothetical protein